MKKWNVASVRASKGVRKLGCCTAYDACFARLADEAGVPIVLVGDSQGMNCLGYETTLPVNMSDTLAAVAAVARGAKEALVVGDMPFGSYQVNPTEGAMNAIRIMKETGCDCLKLEGGEEIIDTVKKILDVGIPIMGHLGLRPQSINKYGTFAVRAQDKDEADKLINDAHLLEEAGCCALVIEKVPAELATKVASELSIPVIGIGAGHGVDGQVLVLQDMLGMDRGFSPKFLRRYADLSNIINDAVGQYIVDVKNVTFPNDQEEY